MPVSLVCSCRGCNSNCVCGTNSLLCTKICSCQGDDKSQNELNKMLVEDIKLSEEVFIENIISSRELIVFHSHVNALVMQCVQKIACVNQMD